MLVYLVSANQRYRKAIQNKFLLTWPGIDEINFYKFVPHAIPTSKGHMSQERKNLRSTKVQLPSTTDDLDQFPKKEKKSKTIFSKIKPYSQREMAQGDFTGRFPFKSSRGNEYIYIVYDYDSNAILAEPITNRQAKTITEALLKIYKRISKNGHGYNHFVLDNKISEELKRAYEKYDIAFVCITPYIHRWNAAERAIGTFKNHVLAGLATCHKQFPITKWDQILPQV